MPKLVYILGLGHSGSTLLDLMLSGSSDICGVGEARMVTHPSFRDSRLKQAESKLCSCGEMMKTCPLWEKYLQLIQPSNSPDLRMAYSALARSFDQTQTAAWMSDSSKDLGTLDELTRFAAAPESPIREIRVVHLVRDVRSFCTSELVRQGKRGALASLRASRLWSSHTQRNIRYLIASQIPFITIGYEELCLYPDWTMQRLSDFLDIAWSESMLKPSPLTAHVSTGNPMRLDPAKRATIKYDHRWFFRCDVMLAYYSLPGLRSLNKSTVYQSEGRDLGRQSFRPPRQEVKSCHPARSSLNKWMPDCRTLSF